MRRSAPRACSTCWRSEPELQERVTAAVCVGERRWNLRFDNGIDVKLPEEDAGRGLGAAWPSCEREHGMLDTRRRRVIDLRLPDQAGAAPARIPPSPKTEDAPGERQAKGQGHMIKKNARRRRATDLIAALDVGTSKMCCFIARVGRGRPPADRRHRPPDLARRAQRRHRRHGAGRAARSCDRRARRRADGRRDHPGGGRSTSPAAIRPRRPSASRCRSPATRSATATCAAS